MWRLRLDLYKWWFSQDGINTGLFNTSVFTESIIRHWLNTLGDAFWQNQSIPSEAVRHQQDLLLHNGLDYNHWFEGTGPPSGDITILLLESFPVTFTHCINGSRFTASWSNEQRKSIENNLYSYLKFNNVYWSLNLRICVGFLSINRFTDKLTPLLDSEKWSSCWPTNKPSLFNQNITEYQYLRQANNCF